MTFDVQPAALALVTVALVVTLWWQRRMWRDIHTWLRLMALVLLAGVALQPGFEHASGEEAPTGMDVVLLVDRTTSMAAQDYDGNRPRIEGVAADVEALVGTMPGARYTVVTSDNEARVAAPWTTDGAAVITLARTIGWREEGLGTGSDIAAGLPLAKQLLQDSAAERPGVRRYFVYLGDGEQISKHSPASFAPLRELIDDALVLGYGTSAGGVMAMHVGTDELVTRDGAPAKSKIDEAALRTIAEQTGGSYQHRTAPGALEGWAPAAGASVSEAAHRDTSLAWWLAVGAATMWCADLAVAARRMRGAKEEL